MEKGALVEKALGEEEMSAMRSVGGEVGKLRDGVGESNGLVHEEFGLLSA